MTPFLPVATWSETFSDGRLAITVSARSATSFAEDIAWACVVLAAVALFVLLYEQPTLRRKFGADYEEYCRNVRAWIPRMRPWVR